MVQFLQEFHDLQGLQRFTSETDKCRVLRLRQSSRAVQRPK